jgi:hypothetical protein
LTSIAVDPANLRRPARLCAAAGSNHVLLAELCSALFQSLPRRDQRRRGLEYVQGLLAARGRKSIRNIAAVIGGQAAEQSLHHFISSSTWDWAPVRQALAQYVAMVAPPQAWVVRPMVIPKAGEHSVGVDRRFFADLGQVRNAQQAIGIWAASEELRTPVNWRLHLSAAWLDDKERRTRASIPEGTGPETIGDGAIDAYLELVERWGMPVRPLVFDARELDTATVVNRLRAARVPFLARVSSTSRFAVADPALTGHGADVLPAQHIMRAAKHLRRPVVWRDSGPEAIPHTCLVASARVQLPVPAGTTAIGGRAGELALLAASEIGQGWPAELWLNNLPATDPGGLLWLTRLRRSVDQDFTQVADRVGVRDFTGRSYSGWHRHVTLASAAHTVAVLADRSVREAA